MAGRDFEELDVYKLACELRKKVYDATRCLPNDEKFCLLPQMRRAAVSVTNNIAEGHGTYTFKQNINYLHISRGSIYEIRDDINVCQEQNYLDVKVCTDLKQLAIRVIKVIDGYIRYLREREASKNSAC